MHVLDADPAALEHPRPALRLVVLDGRVQDDVLAARRGDDDVAAERLVVLDADVVVGPIHDQALFVDVGLEELELRMALRGIGGHLGDPARLVRRREGRGDDGKSPIRLEPDRAFWLI